MTRQEQAPASPLHLRGPWVVVRATASKPTWHLQSAWGYTLASFYSVDAAEYAVRATNSYDKHCGPRAVACAEADLLGEALAALRSVDANLAKLDFDQDNSMRWAIRAILAKASGAGS